MPRFTIEVSDDLNNWLAQSAKQNKRSKNKQIEYLLAQLRKEDEKSHCLIGSTLICSNGIHRFESFNPSIADFCNCGMFVYGEVVR